MKYRIKTLILGAFIFSTQLPLIGLQYHQSIKASQLDSNIDSNYLKQTAYSSYILGPGDVIKIEYQGIEFEETNNALNREFDIFFNIDSEGMANLKRLNRIYVSGLTIAELTELLNKEYKNYFVNSSIKLTLVNFRPIKFYVDGEVINPGMHILPGALSIENKLNRNIEDLPQTYTYNRSGNNNYFFPTLIDALRKSGGITRYSNIRKIKITRKNSISNGGGRIKAEIDLLGALDLSNTSQNIRIYDEDTIFIEKNDLPIVSEISKAFKSNINPDEIKVTVGGRVENNNIFTLGRSAALNDAILSSGGTKFFKGNVTLLRYKSDGSAERRDFAYRKNAKKGSSNNPYLINGDIIYVGKGKLKSITEVLSDITAPAASLLTGLTVYEVFTD